MPDRHLPLARLTEEIRAGSLTSGRYVDDSLALHEALEPTLKAFTWIDLDRVRLQARDLDRRLAAGRAEEPPLAGVPLAVKDIFDTAGIPTECGSPLFRGRVPARDASVVAALADSGAILFGKTVTAELAYATPGPTTNPWNPDRTPGGSSMGSAAAVAAGIVPGSIGTQTNGSVIRPAAFCGVVGFKPSAGRLSLDGVMTFSRTLDQVGAFARSVDDAAWIAAAMARDPVTSWLAPAEAEGEAPLELAVARTSDWEAADPAMRRRFEADLAALSEAGAHLVEAPLPGGLEDGVAVHRTIMAVEANDSLGPLVRERPELVSAALGQLLEEGAGVPAGTYQEAIAERKRLVDAFRLWASRFDAVLTPAARGEAPGLETTGDPRFCTRWTLVGAPAVVIPTGLGPSAMPLGLQLVGAPGSDARLLKAARRAAGVCDSSGLIARRWP